MSVSSQNDSLADASALSLILLPLMLQASQVGQLTPLGAVSLQEFRDCMNEVLSARDAGEEPSWFTAAVDGPQ